MGAKYIATHGAAAQAVAHGTATAAQTGGLVGAAEFAKDAAIVTGSVIGAGAAIEAAGNAFEKGKKGSAAYHAAKAAGNIHRALG